MAEQSFIVSIPPDISSFDREVLGNRIVDFIVARTRKGLDKNNSPFTAYSTSYKESEDFEIAGKSNKVNLTLTGDMLGELRVLRHTVGSITIGYEDGTDENLRAEWMRNPQRNSKTGSTRPARDFLGIVQSDIDKLIAETISITRPEGESRAAREARSILNRILNITRET